MSGEFGTGKTIFVLAIVVGCFAVLWPKVFYPMLTASTATATSKTSLPKTESTGPRAERPAHLHPDMMHPALRERGRALPVRTIDKEAKPGPMPGVRPPMGGGAGHIAPSTNTKASSSMSIIMPLYTVGIIIFFIYTIMKVLFKKCPDDDDKTPKIKNFHMDPEYRKYVFEEEYLDSGDCAKDTFVKRTEQRETVGLRRRHIHDQPDRKIEDEQMDQLRRRLEDTERAMERLMAQMGTVSDKLTAAKITEVLSQAQTQAKLLKDVDNADSNEKCIKSTLVNQEDNCSNFHSKLDEQVEESPIPDKSACTEANGWNSEIPIKLRKSYVCESAGMEAAKQANLPKNLTEIISTKPFDNSSNHISLKQMGGTKVTSLDILNNFALESKGDPYLYLHKSNDSTVNNTQNDATEPPRKKFSYFQTSPNEVTDKAQLENDSISTKQQIFGQIEGDSLRSPSAEENNTLHDAQFFTKCDENSCNSAFSNTSLDIEGGETDSSFQIKEKTIALNKYDHSIETLVHAPLNPLQDISASTEPEVTLPVSEKICQHSDEFDMNISQPVVENTEIDFTISNSEGVKDITSPVISPLSVENGDDNQSTNFQCHDTKPYFPSENGFESAQHFDEEDGDALRFDSNNTTTFQWKTPHLASEVTAKMQSSETNLQLSENWHHNSPPNSWGNVDTSLDSNHTQSNTFPTPKRNKSQIATNKKTLSPKMPTAKDNSEPIPTVPSSARRRRGGRKKRQRLRRSNRLQNQATTASSKGSSPDIQEYEVVQKASGNQQMTRQQLPQTEEKQLHSIDDHFHPKEENIRENSTVDAIESADESELRFSPKTGAEDAPSERTDAVNERGSRIENITSS